METQSACSVVFDLATSFVYSEEIESDRSSRRQIIYLTLVCNSQFVKWCSDWLDGCTGVVFLYHNPRLILAMNADGEGSGPI